MGSDHDHAALDMDWLLACVQAGQTPDEMIDALVGVGWRRQAAMDAVESGLRAYLDRHARENALPAPVRVPAPVAANGPSVLEIDGRRIQVLLNIVHPRVVVFGNLLDAEECEALIAGARGRLRRSTTLNLEDGSDETHPARTSEGAYFRRGEDPLVARIEARIARLLDWPASHGEDMQILRYGPGAEYQPHYDYFEPERPGSAATLARGGQRVASLVMYLNTPAAGGGTGFPDARMEVGAVQGNAVFFSYDRPHPMTGSLHAGLPVREGEKWVATKWLREREHR